MQETVAKGTLVIWLSNYSRPKSKKAQEAIKAVASKVNSNLLKSSQIHEKDGQAPQCVTPYHVNHSQIRPWTYPFQNKVVSTSNKGHQEKKAGQILSTECLARSKHWCGSELLRWIFFPVALVLNHKNGLVLPGNSSSIDSSTGMCAWSRIQLKSWQRLLLPKNGQKSPFSHPRPDSDQPTKLFWLFEVPSQHLGGKNLPRDTYVLHRGTHSQNS